MLTNITENKYIQYELYNEFKHIYDEYGVIGTYDISTQFHKNYREDIIILRFSSAKDKMIVHTLNLSESVGFGDSVNIYINNTLHGLILRRFVWDGGMNE